MNRNLVYEVAAGLIVSAIVWLFSTVLDLQTKSALEWAWIDQLKDRLH